MQISNEKLSLALIDEIFVNRGFSSIQGEMALATTIFGPDSYHKFIENQSSPELFVAAKERESELGVRLDEWNATSRDEVSKAVGLILDDPILDFLRKRNLLVRFFPEHLGKMLSAHLPAYQESVEQEVENLCVVTRGAAIDLKGGEAIVARKQIFNEVARDAFAKIGLSVAGEKDGMLHFSGVGSDGAKISAQMEPSSLTRVYSTHTWPTIRYWPLMQFSFVVKKRAKGEKKAAFMMPPEVQSLAALRLGRYEDSHSLEIAVRALALWIELGFFGGPPKKD
ncbi:hypothetical protein J7373_10935 [Xanthomonas sp. A2111]|uniref:Uncharacterized protein n=1 Tax=Xanthomonas hawaiiensis TaxID=3003247 RepID=A0ABU2I1M3_9XANT|nr:MULTISPECIES: hypothetical protein [unclassified Xanthomonas]MBO9828764.1 hypothetical protein [Xanthomonas sp. A2111]MBO9873943.1 hypothetical protein [Xanthomonas sp. D-93]MDS9992044.1 hypothetical protein [Xanthomonas sp. A2111]WNH43843.1 hypothetical protein PG878_15130 [Xanthomonas sp. A6251]